MCINEIFHVKRPMWSVSVMLQHPCSLSVPIHVHDQCLCDEEDVFTFMSAYGAPSDIQIRSVCLVLSRDTRVFGASCHSGVRVCLPRESSNVTSFEKETPVFFCYVLRVYRKIRCFDLTVPVKGSTVFTLVCIYCKICEALCR
jgi:hypothetical protein